MKKIFLMSIVILVCEAISFSQEFSTNRNPVGLEHNLLFNATNRYTVTQEGTAQINLEYLFDGKMLPSYSSVAIDENNPTVIEISGLPSAHIQQGAWIGWSTRFWMPVRFLIEAYDVYYGNGWVTIADYSQTDFTGYYSFSKKMPAGSFTKLRLTIYKSNGTDGRFGLSELYFLHPEIVIPYYGLYASAASSWNSNGDDINYSKGNVGIGTTSPDYELSVNGTIGAKEVIVTNDIWPDFVFAASYQLKTLKEVECFIKENQHLPDVPSAKEIAEKGISLGEMNALLLQKIEELTLYVIEQDSKMKELNKRINKFEKTENYDKK